MDFLHDNNTSELHNYTALFNKAIEQEGYKDLKGKIAIWEKNIQANKQDNLEDSGEDVELNNSELGSAAPKDSFEDNPVYTQFLSSAERGANLQFLNLSTGFDWNGKKVIFDLESPLNDDCDYTIEDNNSNVLQSGIIRNVVSNSFSIELPIHKIPAGRYYLKFSNSKIFSLLEFFIGKSN